MLKRLCVCAVLFLLPTVPAFAQAHAEVSFSVGWTFSDGVSFSNAFPVNGFVYNRVDPKDSASFGLGVGFFVTPQAEIEFLWNRQSTSLEVSGGGGQILSGDMKVDNFHGNFVYNAFEEDSKMRPYLYIGVGASNYGDADFGPQSGLGGRTIPGLTKFSWAIGTGVKFYPAKALGLRAGVRWVPTYIKTDSVGWWCDPYWGCGPVGNVQYSNQFELGGGVTFRFEP